MRLSPTLPSLGLASILFNALHSQAHYYQLGGKLTIPEPTSPEQLVGTNWQLKEIDGVPAVPELQTLFFETESALSGYDGCNWFEETWGALSATAENDSGSQMIPRPKISIIDYGSSTSKFCSLTPEQKEQQRRFMSALHQAAVAFSLSADEQELTLYQAIGRSSDVPIVMTRIPIPAKPHEVLIGTSWLATDIYYSDPYSEKRSNRLIVLEDHPVTMSFGKDTFFGSTGTNKYVGDITMRKFNGVSMEFQVTNVAQTSIGFMDDQDPLLLQEHAWMDIIEAASDEIVTIPYILFDERIGDTDEFTQVLLLGSSQAPLARFVPFPNTITSPLSDINPDEWTGPIKKITSPLSDTNQDIWQESIQLSGSNWRATNIRGKPLSDDTDVNMFFASEYYMKGSGGCNQFDASWETMEMLVHGTDSPLIRETLNVWGMATSAMFCDGMIRQVENAFFNGLEQESILEFDGQELKLWDAVRNENGQKTRGNFLGLFVNIPVPSWGGESLIGMAGEDALRVVKSINPSLNAFILPPDHFITTVHRLDRVVIHVDEDGKVTREPQRG